MTEGNQICDAPNCSDPVIAFGLRGTLKLRTCDRHMSKLLVKEMSIYTIDKFTFISSQEDAAVYEKRKAVVDRALGNLGALDAHVDAEYAAALRLLESEKRTLIETIDALFLEIQRKVTERHGEVKKHFSSLAANLHQYIQHRDSELLPSAELLCGEVQMPPKFISLDIAGISDPVVSAINHYWSVSADEIEPLLLTAVSGSTLPITVETARLFSQKGVRALMAQKWKNAEESLLQAKMIYERCAPRSADAASNLNLLGLLFTETKKLNEAEGCFQGAQEILNESSPQSVEVARTHHYYGLLCLELNRVSDAEQHYQQARSIYEAAGIQSADILSLIEGLGSKYSQQRQFSKALEFYQQALQWYQANDQQSVRAAVVWFQAGVCYVELRQWKESEYSFLWAKAIFEANNSKYDEYGKCLNNLGLVYEAQNRLEESIAYLQAAVELYALNNSSEGKSKAEANIDRVQAKMTSPTLRA